MDGIRSLRYPTSRRLLGALIFTVCLLLTIRAFFLEPFQVPTGSMAPALVGHHRSAVCPRCGFSVDMGRADGDTDGSGGERYYAGAFCPNCGYADLPLAMAPEAHGDQVLVNKVVYAFRKPRRWEVVVFRQFGKTFIKRLIGLAGEEIEIVDGDIYIDGKLSRKSLDDVISMRALLFDNDFAPEPDGWKERWEFEPARAVSFSRSKPLLLDGLGGEQKLTYRHFTLDERKCLPITDEYAYNGPRQRTESVHDFMAEADVEIVRGQGTLSFALNDGGTEVVVEFGPDGASVHELFNPEPTATASRHGASAVAVGSGLNERGPLLSPGKRYHIEIAFVDRRFSARVNGEDAFTPVDFTEAKERSHVTRPLRITAKGVVAHLHHMRLYRDVHYTQAGKNAVHGRTVRLSDNEFFVLGDNSARSEDSRFWPSGGAVPMNALLGKAFLVHWPSRAAIWSAFRARLANAVT